jgi:hypothetical protein
MLATLGLLQLALLGRTWVVDIHGFGDFTEIQPAIDAASDGDLVLVHGGDYPGFTLRKRVTVKAIAVPFTIRDPIEIADVPAGSGAAVVSGVTVPQSYRDDFLAVHDCDGEVVLESCWYAAQFRGALFAITDCTHVSIVESGTSTFTADDGAVDSAALVSITRSHVSATSLRLDGGDGGFPAIETKRSTLTLAAAAIRGGRGIPGLRIGPWRLIDQGAGGPGIFADRSDVLAIGDEDAAILGGDGGCTIDGEVVGSCGAPFGPGGIGVVLDDCTFVVSRCIVRGGDGDSDGADHSGDTFTRDDSFPFMTLAPTLRIGQSTTLALDAVQTGSAILLISDQGGLSSTGPKWSGPPLSVLSG